MRLLQVIMPTKPEFDNTINKILQGKEYRHLKNPINDFLGNIKEALRQWIFGIIKNTFSATKAVSISDKVADSFLVIGILVVLVVVIVIILKAGNISRKSKKIKEILGEKIDERTTPNSLRNKAISKAKEGELRLAIRFDFIAILLLMHQLNLLFLDETQTNEEMHNYLAIKHFTYLQGFKDIINRFNYTWYGNKEPSEELFSEWKNDFDTLWNGVIKYEEKK